MAWDSTRPVPWTRLMREWVIYALIMTAVFLLFFRSSNVIGAIVGVLISGPLYLGIGAVLAKFGYQRKTFKQARDERQQQLRDKESERASGSSSDSSGDTPRPKPPPTKRTLSGSNRPKSSSKRKR